MELLLAPSLQCPASTFTLLKPHIIMLNGKTKDQPVYRSGVILTPRSHRTKLIGANIHYGHSNVKKTTEATTEDELKSAIFFPVMTP